MKTLAAKNYRSYESIDIEFSPGINIVIGRTDNGKSNIVRLLRDFFFNATGDDFIQAGKNHTEVEIDGMKWVKGKGKNEYHLPGYTKPFSSVGAKSPDELKTLTGIREVQYGSSTRCLNITSQLDPHFLISENPSDNALLIASLSDISRLFNGLQNASHDLSSGNGEVKRLREQLDTLKQRAEGYKWVRGYKHRLNTVQGGSVHALASHRTASNAREGIQALSERQDALKQAQTALKRVQQKADIPTELSDNARRWQEAGVVVARLEALKADYARAKKSLADADAQAEALHAEMEKALTGTCPITQEPMSAECRKAAMKALK